MSYPAVPSSVFNKTKEDFIWFIKRASADKKSDAHTELYHCLLKMFVDADTNNDGLVSKNSFSKLIDMAVSIPRLYGYAPADSELYTTEKVKHLARKNMFDSMDLKNTGVITFDQWYQFSMEHIIAKTAGLAPHPILDHGDLDQFKMFLKSAVNPVSAEYLELYWFLVELFTEHDFDKDGIVVMVDYPAMMDRVLETPKKLGVAHPDQVLYESDAAKRKAHQEVLFKTYNPVGDDKMCLDEWIKLAMDGFYKKLIL